MYRIRMQRKMDLMLHGNHASYSEMHKRSLWRLHTKRIWNIGGTTKNCAFHEHVSHFIPCSIHFKGYRQKNENGLYVRLQHPFLL